ncbi:MAG: acyltransferase family protein [Nocardioidaceae bacterium]
MTAITAERGVGALGHPAAVLRPDGEGRSVRLVRLSTTRIVGALLVVVSHAGITYGLLGPGTARAPYRLVGLALAPVVSYFFVLTGFVITWSYAERLDWRTFYRGRVARLVPTNTLWWALGCLVVIWYGFHITRLGALLTLVMAQGWVADERVVLAADPAAWSLSVDVVFYALFPLLLPAVTALHRWHRLALVPLLVLVQVQLAALSDLHAHHQYQFAVAYFPLSRLPEFLLGVIAALELRAGRLPRVPLRLALLGGALAMVLARVAVGTGHPAYEWSAVCALPSVLLIVAIAQTDLADEPSWLTTPFLVSASSWTFALYILQVPVMRATLKLAGLPRDVGVQYLLAAVTSALCVLLAWAQYRWYEQPLDRWIRGRRLRPDPVPAIAP